MMITEAYRNDRTPILDDEGNPKVLVSFDVNEEIELARAVFSLLRRRPFTGDDRDFLEDVYWEGRCRTGAVLWADEFERTIEIIEKWSSYGWFDVYKPAFMNPNFQLSDTSMFGISGRHGLPSTDDFTANVNAITNLMMMWRSEWEKVRDDLIQLSDAYKEFSGSKAVTDRHYLRRPDAQLERALRFEMAFWAEVDEVQNKMPLSRQDCYDYARDYMRRGRDVIPRVLMRHWMEVEEMLPTEYPKQVHYVREDWVDDAIKFSVDQERLMPKTPDRAN